jgi:hypothetical protein
MGQVGASHSLPIIKRRSVSLLGLSGGVSLPLPPLREGGGVDQSNFLVIPWLWLSALALFPSKLALIRFQRTLI